MTTDPQPDPLTVARATNQRLNLRAQQLESELAAYRRAVSQWEVSDQHAYVPLRSLAAIAKAAGQAVPERWELHYQRVERAEAALASATAAAPVVPPAPADRAALLREAADLCDEAGAVYASKALNDHAGAAFTLMERFLRKADEAEYVATPCSLPNVCEDGGEPCSTHERLMAHVEGDHELCEPDCGTSPSRVAEKAQHPETPTNWTPGPVAVARAVAATRQPGAQADAAQFGSPDCTCIPFVREGGTARYCQPGDTVDQISGWERGGDCPHHRTAA